MKEGVSVLTYYQRTILATLIDYSYQAVELLKVKYDVNLLLKWRRLIKQVEKHFQLPSFIKNAWDHSYSNPLCDKGEDPDMLVNTQRFMILRELLEFSKILIKTVINSDDAYDQKSIFYRLIYITLPSQFGFNYAEHVKFNPPAIDVPVFLIQQGMIEIQLAESEFVWVHPHNFNEDTFFFSSGIFLHEAEGLCYLGGISLLSKVIQSCRLNLHESVQYHRGRKLNL
ncbi:hypothetical protein [Brevibacillus laterosporus]|uniref:Uncharacterized protein n=1 Tax=Brevibacillus laterosporus TaxID=1465 RepID=A0AAP8U4K3_BRELA|nr:hypothetical protein [Brevibacillus laterosporus]MED1662767.1 hypothetical protein [Brevibacillus laterosporus]MED1669107.1 hypothetical protein [Brevibacillus laterosporus]MED1720582.1 hypothetical protein [Brevibacillus laterosporus]PPA88352.1 hypothetical protein C4A76_08325 [Brevibacillus laterosporus]PPA93929.1 hypothetical protein C4A77_15835 [Brevibacillus laterosporus]